jgi:Class II flagellar assembly regulator
MVGIEGIGRPTTPRLTGRRPPGMTGFAVPSGPSTAGQAAAATAAQPASLASMLTLQELGGETVQDREARRHGHDMLAVLAALQRALLADEDDPAALAKLAELAGAVPLATDRRIAAIISAIVVRVRVELARRPI